MKFKAAIFDMDGTLVDSLVLWDVLWADFGKKYLNGKRFAPSDEDDKAVRTLTLKDAMRLIHEKYAVGSSADELLLRANGIISDFYRNKVELKEGAGEFLEYCRSRGVRMCIASATAPELIELALEHCGIRAYFSAVISCSELGAGKDKPDVFLRAMEHLGTGAEGCVVFEDSLTAIRTAVSLGIPAVGIYDRFNYGQDEIKRLASVYIAEGETLMKLAEKR